MFFGKVTIMDFDFSQVTKLSEHLYYSVLFHETRYTPEQLLFHYTDAAAKSKIIDGDHVTLKLSRVKDFEDVEEGRHILKVYDVVYQEFSHQYSDRKFNALMQSVKNNFLPHLEENINKYVFCFSKSENNEYLINHYAHRKNSQGYCIGFHALKIEDIIEKCNGVHLVDVLYDSDNLAQSMKKVIYNAYRLREQDDEDFSILKKILLYQLLIYSLCYKSPEFKVEEETRLIVAWPQDPPSPFSFIQGNLFLELGESAYYNSNVV